MEQAIREDWGQAVDITYDIACYQFDRDIRFDRILSRCLKVAGEYQVYFNLERHNTKL